MLKPKLVLKEKWRGMIHNGMKGEVSLGQYPPQLSFQT